MGDPREMFRRMPFPFADDVFPAQLGAIVQRTVLSGDEPAREVIHTVDGSWLIGDGVHDPNELGAVVATHIWHAIERNSSIADLADLQPGSVATRGGPGEPWVIERHHWPDDEASL